MLRLAQLAPQDDGSDMTSCVGHMHLHTFAVIARLDRAIQYSEASVIHREAAAYWIPRRSLSSGSPKARPGGGE
ncbi:hypothetical protein WN72_42675 [Bradyrhizobium arachidis]|uniref:Uncharacterized protein n=1 Tax=Bradyrhizobium arachidis TaxID=858423 RepID=A0AAE7P034_9BRAD|nr:hypothetical protein WN72_42675 [Bradyrhizobium arachidis]